MSEPESQIVLTFFPFFFISLWLFVTSLLGLLAGWFSLQKHYPRGDDDALLTLRGLSGRMGMVGVNFSGVLRLSACPSGLRVGLFRLFGPFQRPFTVPWNAIDAQPKASFFFPMVRLGLGRPEIGTLTISRSVWARLAAASPAHAMAAEAMVDGQKIRRGFLVQWIAITVLAGSFFFFASRLGPDPVPVPAMVCFGFPAIVLGVGLLIRWLRER